MPKNDLSKKWLQVSKKGADGRSLPMGKSAGLGFEKVKKKMKTRKK